MQTSVLAPGARVEIRGTEWIVRRNHLDWRSFGGCHRRFRHREGS